MMIKWALVVDGIVVEITDIDPSGRFHPDMVWIPCGDEIIAGSIFDGVGFSAPSAPANVVVVPQEITAWQGLTTLNQEGLYASVKAYVDALPDDGTGTQAKIDFYRASVWKRSWSWLNDVAKNQLAMTDEQIDAMFIAASVL